MKRFFFTFVLLLITSSATWSWAEDADPPEQASGTEQHEARGAIDAGHPAAGDASAEDHEPEQVEEDHGEEHGGGTSDAAPGGGEHGEEEGLHLPLWSVFPFILMLLCIAVLPLTYEHWWEHNKNKFIVACVLGIPVGLYFLAFAGHHGQEELLHVMLEYLAFMFLLGSLYVISGGILLRGDLEATPKVNTTFLAVGALLASFMGTTGAAMLLIRPLISTNSERRLKVHTIIFFTFLVANVGGSLTPLGDPPLFMGYLRGVPFTWTFNLLPVWLFTSVLLLTLYYFLDRWRYKQEAAKDITRDREQIEKLSIKGLVNIPLLVGVIASVAFGQELNNLSGGLLATTFGVEYEGTPPGVWTMIGLREVVMALMALASMMATSKKLRSDNEFTFAPIVEVAALFFGIFLTMIPAIVLLNERGGELPVSEPWHYFWATGTLSSFLDNTPTYIVFFELGATKAQLYQIAAAGGLTVGELMVRDQEMILEGISLGAVFMGAMTYIGNGPNFMVKAIADERGVKMPSFFGYMIYSCAILIPTFILVTLIFL
jgi:Na+/H+ antiporter NhaD/arsenite permease-like protein